MKIKTAVSLVMVFTLVLAGCGVQDLIGILELAVNGAGVLADKIDQDKGVDPEIKALADKYKALTLTALGQSSAIWAGPGTDAWKTAETIAAFSNIAIPTIPDKYQGIAQAVQELSVLVAHFLAGLPVSSTQPLAVRARGSAPVAIPGKTTVLSASDRQRLAAVKAKVLSLQH